MFSKLAVKNVVRSVRDYSVYFITLLFGVCVFYVFNSMESQTVMGYLGGGTSPYVQSILLLIDVISVFVSVVLAFLILYANTFMIRRRKRELGTYLLLGMERGKVSILLFLETLCIGLLALAAGLLLGVFLSQFISVFTAGLFSIHMTEWHFVFSPKAVGKTCLYFGVIFVLVMMFNSLSVSRCRLLDLMQAERSNQDLKLKSVGASVVMFLVGVALLIIAYAMLLQRGLFRVDGLFWLMLGLGSLGTLLFFRSLSGFLLRVCQRNKKLYYRGLNMFILRQFNSKINTTYVSMTVICLMLLLAIGITATSLGLNNTVEGLSSGKSPYDVSVYFWPSEGGAPAELEQWLAAGGFDPEEELEERMVYETAQVEFEPVRYELGGREVPLSSLSALSLSDCNALLALQGLPPLELGEDEYGLLWGTYEADYSLVKALWEDQPTLSVAGTTLTPQPGAETSAIIRTGTSRYESMLILPDQFLEGRPADSVVLVGNYPAGADVQAADARLEEAMHSLVPRDYESGDGGYGYGWDTRLGVYMDTMGSKILVLFIGIYLGIIFLLTSAAVLALQQLSQAADNAGRYRILARLGVEESMRDRSIYVQIFLYFFLPLALAVVHSIVGMTAANAAIAEVGHVDSVSSSVATAAFILVVYGAYFLATCAGSRRIVRGR